MALETSIAEGLLEIKAVQIRPKKEDYFTWTSGIKSPIYCDNRLTMSFPKVRKKIVEAFIKNINELQLKPDVIAGCATAGIPHAAWIADALELPMIYVRSKPKGHGKGNQIEGQIKKGQKVVVIEDLISTGGSSIEAAQVLQQEGADVLSVLAIFTYGLPKAKQNFEDVGILFATITGFDALLTALKETNDITETEHQELLAWRQQL